MAGIIISPKFDTQIRSRLTHYKRCSGSPNFRDMLRDRCRARIKAKRGALFEKMRCSQLSEAFSEMLQEEIKDLTNPLPIMYEMDIDLKCEVPVDNETSKDEESYLLEEYEKFLAQEEAMYSSAWDEQVICPICELAALRQVGSEPINCPNCASCFSSVTDMKYLKQSIYDSIQYHQMNCEELPQFAFITENLFLICESCGCWYQIA